MGRFILKNVKKQFKKNFLKIKRCDGKNYFENYSKLF